MLKMYEARDRFIGGNFEAWLFTIARNAARTEFRNRRRRPTVDIVDELQAEPRRGIEEEDEADQIRAAIARLPVEYRTVVMLKYFADMGVADIAESEGISAELVKTRLYRARQKLANILRHLVEETA
jgi:RNA polymerase sigma-70 factor (ECF subfamily)